MAFEQVLNKFEDYHSNFVGTGPISIAYLFFLIPSLVYKVLRIPNVSKPTFIKNTFDIS